MDAPTRALAPGLTVRLEAASGETMGLAHFNPHALIAARLIAREPVQMVGQAAGRDLFAAHLKRALALRELLYPGGCYRLVHAEADGLPGLIVDRFARAAVIKANTAGMDRSLPEILAALDLVLAPEIVVVRNDAPSRALEGLASEIRVVRGTLDGAVELVENGARYLADLERGQKTGWFYDQRDNRAALAGLAGGARVLDVYAYGGGFAILCAIKGAAEVVALDRSEPAL